METEVMLTKANSKYPAEYGILLEPLELILISEITFSNAALRMTFVNSSGISSGDAISQHSEKRFPLYVDKTNVHYNSFYFQFEMLQGNTDENAFVRLKFDKVKMSTRPSNILLVKTPVNMF